MVQEVEPRLGGSIRDDINLGGHFRMETGWWRKKSHDELYWSGGSDHSRDAG